MSQRAEDNRILLVKHVRRNPFAPFFIRLESGDRLSIRHPELVSFYPDPTDSQRVNIKAQGLDIDTTLDAITGVAIEDAELKASKSAEAA
ncbi:MAG: hypothetical protein AAF561_08370 [Planctomycetota bacterium]